MHVAKVLLEQWHEPGHNTRAWQPTWASLRSHAWQYVEYYDRSGAVTFREYYNLTRDPWELHSTIAETQDRATRASPHCTNSWRPPERAPRAPTVPSGGRCWMMPYAVRDRAW